MFVYGSYKVRSPSTILIVCVSKTGVPRVSIRRVGFKLLITDLWSRSLLLSNSATCSFIF